MVSRQLAATATMVRAALLGKIQYMVLHVNSVCNARCRMCFNWDAMQKDQGLREPSVENLARLARSMHPLPQLTCSGGEPFLRKDLFQIIHAFYNEGGTRFFTIPTNSLQPDRVDKLIADFIEKCPKAFLNFCLPFHGDADHYDDIMGVPGSFSKFQETYEVIQRARVSHPNVSCLLNFVMSKFNYKYYKNIIDFANAAFPGAPLGIAYARGLTHERDATDIPINTYMEAQRYLEAQKRNHTRANPYTLMFDSINGQTASIIRDTVTGKRTDLGCGAGRHFIVVYDNGAVYPCELLEHIGIPEPCRSGEHQPTDPCLGNLNDYNYDMYALLASPPAEELVRWIDHHKCSCTWECAIYSKIMHSPKEWGKLAGAAVRYLFKRRVVPSTSPQVRAD